MSQEVIYFKVVPKYSSEYVGYIVGRFRGKQKDFGRFDSIFINNPPKQYEILEFNYPLNTGLEKKEEALSAALECLDRNRLLYTRFDLEKILQDIDVPISHASQCVAQHESLRSH